MINPAAPSEDARTGADMADPLPQRTAPDDQMREYASLSQASYDHTSKGYEAYGWQVTGGGDGLVTFQRAGEDGAPQYAVAYKGTSLSGPTAAADLGNDAVIVAGAEATGVGGFDENADFAKRYIDEVAGGDASKVTLTGHSLGGQKAIQASRATGAKAVVYNPGVSPLSVATFAASPGLSDVTIYHAKGDAISSSSLLLKPSDHVEVHTVHPGKQWGPWYVPLGSAHALSNFL